MSTIEPDLTTRNVGQLKQKYEKETKQDEQKRIGRYKKAIRLYREKRDAALARMKEEAQHYINSLRQFAENEVRSEEQQQLKEIENLFD